MGLLAPLYALAALAVVGPIIFHLIRRQPQGQMHFSSLMFLSPSPPKLTRRSRLDNLPLLMLRALAILLIAIAFARPYLRQESFLTASLAGRSIVAIVDTSGSMQRNDVWAAAQRELNQLLDSLSPRDRISLYTLAETLEPVLGFEEGSAVDVDSTQQAVRVVARELKPTWGRGQISEGLKTAAELINAAAITGNIDPTESNEIVLITDLHGESGLESLQGYVWPENIQLDVRQVQPSLTGNAYPRLMQGDPEAEESESIYRVRVENDSNSLETQFQLSWASNQGLMSSTATTIQVPPGQVRIVPMVSRPAGADRITLVGDAWDGDNAAFVVQPVLTLERIAFVGSAQRPPEDSLVYFLEQAPLGTELYRREIIAAEASDLPTILAEPETKAVVLELDDTPVSYAADLRRFAQKGGVVIACLARPSQNIAGASGFLNALLEVDGLSVTEADTKDFALLSLVDFRHPVFAPFADPRFNDFGKIRFWTHRVVQLPLATETHDTNIKVVAHYDDDSPMLIEQSVGSGRIWLLTCGWQPNASGLGLSSKFVPLLMGMLDPSGRTRGSQMIYEVGQAVDTAIFGQQVRLTDADGSELDESLVARHTNSVKFLAPRLVWLEGQGVRRQIAVQVPASESRLVPMDKDIFEQYDIPLGKVASDNERRESLRQLRVEELERKQRLWQWLIVACLVVLAVETLLAGWLAKA